MEMMAFLANGEKLLINANMSKSCNFDWPGNEIAPKMMEISGAVNLLKFSILYRQSGIPWQKLRRYKMN
jgi:hypothetical protein